MEHEERLKAALADRYQIEREIGRGGMAVVYLAQDLKHNRQVAVKVLNPELSAVVGTERFLAEIKTTANLSHPHILPLFDSGEAAGFLFYVMPLVEGENLRQKLDRDGQLQVEKAVRIAGHVADALDHAHRHGVIHRDLKPANILFQDGEPVVADFGIALAVREAGGPRVTETGLSLGTPQYMSPEQASGDQVPTPASDVYSMGCVLYEMLTGDPPHIGSSAQVIVGKILLGEITRPTKLRHTIPANVEGAVLKALERLPADRFGTAAEMAGAMKDQAFRHMPGGAPPEKTWNRMTVGWASLAGALAVVAFIFGVAQFRDEAVPGAVVRFRVSLQEDQLFAAATGVDVALSPDGSRIVYVGIGGDVGTRLWQRSLDQLEPSPIRGTNNPSNPAVSPSGQSVAFITGGALLTVSFEGGPPTPVLHEGVSPRGLDWGSDDFLYFTNLDGAIQRVPATGGTPEAVTFPRPSARHTGVDVLPRGKGVLFTVNSDQPGGASIIGVADLEGGPARVLFEGTMARYLPPGYVVFSNTSRQLMAAAFDLGRLEATSQPELVASGLTGTSVHYSEFALSETGSLAYRGAPLASSGDLVWVSRDGLVEEIDPDWEGDFRNPSLSPDDGRLAFDRVEGGIALLIRDLQRGSNVRLRVNPTGEHRPAWTPNGRSVTYSQYKAGQDLELWTIRADRTGEPELSLQLDRGLEEGIWSSDGDWLVGRTDNADPGAGDILAIRLAVDSVAVPLAVTPLRELSPSLSPDGRFLAFTSQESGRLEVVIIPFPNAGDWRQVVSPTGGTEPVWGNSGRELFYRNAAGDLVSVDITTTPEFTLGQERVLFSAQAFRADPQHAQYDVSLDDERFLMIRTQVAGTYGLVFVGNFLEEVRAKVGR